MDLIKQIRSGFLTHKSILDHGRRYQMMCQLAVLMEKQEWLGQDGLEIKNNKIRLTTVYVKDKKGGKKNE